jgi:hypothetical protein
MENCNQTADAMLGLIDKRCRQILPIVLTLFILVAASLSGGDYVQPLRRDPLAAAMQAAGGQFQEYSVNAWAKLRSMPQSDEELERIVNLTMRRLGVNGEYSLRREYTDKKKVVVGNAANESVRQTVAAEWIYPGKYNQGGFYVIINVICKSGNMGDFTVLQQKVTKIIYKIGLLPRINTCLTGRLNGKLSEEECQVRLQSAFHAAGATIVDTLYNGNYFSYTGFSPNIAGSLSAGGNKLNLNIAMRYSQFDNRTYILIGSPVITREY